MNIDYNWKKHAAQMVSDDHQVERAFMDQAYQFLNNKGGALMKDPYRLGFEIVHKNDSNTRMVGIFAFRIGDNLLYVPTFFLNGEIKGTDLLYRHDSKTFVPLDDNWVKFLINKASRHMGQGVDPMNSSPKDINLDDLAYPPGFQSKRASEENTLAPGQYLKNFILTHGGYEAIEKLAHMLESNIEFARAFTERIPEDCWMPKELHEIASDLRKQAAQANRPDFILSVGSIDTLKDIPSEDREKAAANLVKRGYNLWEAPQSLEKGNKAPVYSDYDAELTEVSEEPGYWKVVLHDGSTRMAFVAPQSELTPGRGDDSIDYAYDSVEAGYEHPKPQRKHIVFDNGDTISTRYNQVVMGELDKDVREATKELSTEMTPGTAYRIFDAEGGTLSDIIKCTAKTRKAGIDHYLCCRSYGDKFAMRRNPDSINNDIGKGTLGKHSYFIKVNVDKPRASGAYTDDDHFDVKRVDVQLGTCGQMRDWCLESNVKQASLIHDRSIEKSENFFSLKHSFSDHTRTMNRPSMLVKLATQYHIAPETAEEMMDRAVANGEFSFLYGTPEKPHVKSATMVRLTDEPNFQTYHDDEFDVDMEYPQSFALGSDTDQDDVPMQRIGDAFDPSMGMGMQPQQDGDGLPLDKLLTMAPEQLAQIAQSDDVPQIFEHGVVGSLVQTYDAVSAVDQYIPDMEQALDKLGRLLFLFYWKPRDFEDAYGTDDMSNMENQILSNFRSFGELTLELLKKSETLRKGTVSLAGE